MGGLNGGLNRYWQNRPRKAKLNRERKTAARPLRSSPERRLFAVLVCALAIALPCLPATLQADLADDIADVFRQSINGLQGNEFAPVSLSDEVIGFHYEVVLLGFAFCVPAYPWAEPIPIPVPPYNVYECENFSTVNVLVSPDETSADVVIEVSDLFLDLEVVRDYGLCPLAPYWEIGSGPPVNSEEYILSGATFELTLGLERVGGCIQATLDPESVIVTFDSSELAIRDDDCLASVANTFEPLVWNLLTTEFRSLMRAELTDLMLVINDLLCDATPVNNRTWGGVKNGFRPAARGEMDDME